VNVDPQTIKELLKLQLLSQSSLLSSTGTSAQNESGLSFNALLDQFLGSAPAASPVAATSELVSNASRMAARTPFKMTVNPMSAADYERRSSIQEGRPTSFEPAIKQASNRYGIDPGLVKAVIHAESSFNPEAVSKAGAKGLMQLMDATGAGLGVTDPFDPVQNINGGTKYLAGLMDRYNGNEAMALAAYNAGSGRVAGLGVRSDQELMDKLHLLPKETQNYVRKVLQLKDDYQM
jgi:soluble lytic murein transglycosylase-like protein